MKFRVDIFNYCFNSNSIFNSISQVLLHRDRQENCPPASLLLATDDSEQFSLVVLLLRWTVAGPAVVSYGLAMSMPLALVAEKCVATVCFKRYENGRRFSVVGFTILALQVGEQRGVKTRNSKFNTDFVHQNTNF